MTTIASSACPLVPAVAMPALKTSACDNAPTACADPPYKAEIGPLASPAAVTDPTGSPLSQRPNARVRTPGERHRSARGGWLRAAVLGANDGIVSTSSLVLGMASAGSEPRVLLLTGLSGLIAGAMSMAAGEYVSVQSQQDTERADLRQEQAELLSDPAGERRELTAHYVGRGLDADLALRVSEQLSARDALGAHARDELGQTETTAAQPVQAALTSAASFTIGASLPIGVVMAVDPVRLVVALSIGSLLFLGVLGAISSRIGGAPIWPGVRRVTFWGALAMGVTASAGALLGVGN